MKLALITGTRADWGLLKPLYIKLKQNHTVEVVATGSHLSSAFGHTVKEVEAVCNPHKIEIVLSSDSAVSISKAAGLAMISMGELYERINPQGVIMLGDRFEALACALSAHICGVPVVHIHGGEETVGSYDNGFRYAITAMSSLHFAATERARNKIIRSGKLEETVFCVGALGCDGLVKRTGQPKDGPIIFMFYPQTAGGALDEAAVINAVSALPGDKIIIKGGYDKAAYRVGNLLGGAFDIILDSVGRDKFIECLARAKCIIGNSSSGIIEAPALGVPTINIGSRQQGRERAASVIDCEPTQESIRAALARLESPEFMDIMNSNYYTPYRGENVAEQIAFILGEQWR